MSRTDLEPHICPACGTVAAPMVFVCPACRTLLTQPARRVGSPRWVLAVLLVGILVLAVYAAYLAWQVLVLHRF